MIPMIADIRRATCAECNLTDVDLLSDRRARSVSWPRQMAMYLTREMTTRSLPDIGYHFGGRDHSTVIHAIRQVEARKRFPETVQALNAIRKRVLALMADAGGDGVSGD